MHAGLVILNLFQDLRDDLQPKIRKFANSLLVQ
jgi:hypothetical protein